MSNYGLYSDGYRAWYISALGYLYTDSLTDKYNAKPVLFLSKDVKLISGTGVEKDPYIIS